VSQNTALFQDFLVSAQSDPSRAQILVHYDRRKTALSKIVELIERLEGELSSIHFLGSKLPGFLSVLFKLRDQDVSHIVIAIIEDLHLEAYGCGPQVSTTSRSSG